MIETTMPEGHRQTAPTDARKDSPYSGNKVGAWRRSAVVEAALRYPDMAVLTNAVIAQRLNVGLHAVRWTRRRLESSGQIPSYDQRITRHGRAMDVSRISAATRKWGADIATIPAGADAPL